MIHRSARTKRKVRSTLAGEAEACDSATDSGYYLSVYTYDIITGTRATRRSSVLDLSIPLYAVTDCKSLYDVVQKVQPQLEEKRTAIDVASIKETLHRDHLKWVPSDHMLADSLTKIDKKLREKLTEFLRRPYIALKNATG